jgi:hypothetical protein
MAKMFLTALLCGLGALAVLYVVQPVDAAEPGHVIESSVDRPAMPPVIEWPAPQAPFDNTPITPVETVGAAQFEPF